MDDLLLDFLAEAKEHLDELDVALGKLEAAPGDAATLSRIVRPVHSIKWACGVLGLARLERVAQAGEKVLRRMCDGELAASADTLGLIRSMSGRIREIISGFTETAAEAAGDDRALVAALDALAAGETVPAGASPAPAAAAASAAPAATQPAAGTPAVPDGTSSRTVCVAVEVLEDLMTRMSELVLTRNQLLPLLRTQQSESLATPLRRLGQITAELQAVVMKARMQPVGNAWNQLPGLVRDLERGLGRKIDFTMIGAETGLDHPLVERIKDPLAALVRYSAQHGIEGPAQRRGRGKPEAGRITLTAYHVGGHVVFEIADDGRGLGLEKTRAGSLAPGLATVAAAGGVCGGGAALDAVSTSIGTIGGTFDVESVVGEGTVFTIRIPTTLAVVSALIVESGGERFAIPRVNVLALVPGGPGAESPIECIVAAPLLRLRNQLWPLVSLDSLLQIEGGGEESEQRSIVVVQVGPSRIGVLVDRVFEPEEVVVKPGAPILRAITMFAGNTVLRDGSAAMVLDPHGIARAGGLAAQAEQRRAAAAGVPGAPAMGRSSTGRG